jgi:hypothetical protein
MNIFKECWPKFKQELVPIVYLSTVQVWMILNFPLYVKMGSFWMASISIASVILCVALFSSIDKYAHCFDLSYLDHIPNGQLLKTIQKAIIIGSCLIGMFFIWYKNLYGLPNAGYALLYIHFFIAFVLIKRAAERSPSE